jgi:hypothetical protein
MTLLIIGISIKKKIYIFKIQNFDNKFNKSLVKDLTERESSIILTNLKLECNKVVKKLAINFSFLFMNRLFILLKIVGEIN